MSFDDPSLVTGFDGGGTAAAEGPEREGAAEPFAARWGAGDEEATRWSSALRAIALQIG